MYSPTCAYFIGKDETKVLVMIATLMNLAHAKLQPEAKYGVQDNSNVFDIRAYLQSIAPDALSTAAVGRNRLHFIDTRSDGKTAVHLK